MWDVGGNEAYFFIRDVTHGSAFPFRIQPGAPSGSLSVKNDGRIGLGTWYPESALEVERTGADANLVLDRTDGAKVTLAAGSSGATLGTVTGHSMQVRGRQQPAYHVRDQRRRDHRRRRAARKLEHGTPRKILSP